MRDLKIHCLKPKTYIMNPDEEYNDDQPDLPPAYDHREYEPEEDWNDDDEEDDMDRALRLGLPLLPGRCGLT